MVFVPPDVVLEPPQATNASIPTQAAASILQRLDPLTAQSGVMARPLNAMNDSACF
jgi:hypothetical protein